MVVGTPTAPQPQLNARPIQFIKQADALYLFHMEHRADTWRCIRYYFTRQFSKDRQRVKSDLKVLGCVDGCLRKTGNPGVVLQRYVAREMERGYSRVQV